MKIVGHLPPFMRPAFRTLHLLVLGALWIPFLILGIYGGYMLWFDVWPVNTGQLPPPPTFWSIFWPLFVLPIPLLGLVAYFIYHRYRFLPRLQNRIIESNHQLCGQCGHMLRGLFVSGPCPECGKLFAPEVIRSFWKRFHNARFESASYPKSLFYLHPKPWITLAKVVGFLVFIVVMKWIEWDLTGKLSISSFKDIPLYLWMFLLMIEGSASDRRTRNRKLVQKLIESKHQLCGRCAHDLSECSESGSCPHCKRSFHLPELRALWKEHAPPHWELEMTDPKSTTLPV